MSRARLGRYALYQLQDYLVERGLVTLLLVALTMGPTLWVLLSVPGSGGGRDPLAVAQAALRDMATPIGTVAVLFAVHGISSLDRQRGYFRFLFSKPVSVPAYYAQDFVVRFAGATGVVSLALLVFALASGTPFQAGFLAYVGVAYALLGGIGFLLSALVSFDGLALVLVWVASAVLLQLHARLPGRVPAVLVRALPPVDKLDAARDAFVGGVGAFPPAHLWWAVGYGLACFALGLVVLSRRELAR